MEDAGVFGLSHSYPIVLSYHGEENPCRGLRIDVLAFVLNADSSGQLRTSFNLPEKWPARTLDKVTSLLWQNDRVPASSRCPDKISHVIPCFFSISLICMLHVFRISKYLRNIPSCTLALFQLIYPFVRLCVAQLRGHKHTYYTNWRPL